MTHPLTLEGIRFAVDGNDDAYYIEGTDFARYSVADQAWLPEGDVVDIDGGSATCTWTDDGCS